MNRIRRITSHVGVSRYMDTLEDIGFVIPRQAEIPSPYAYSPDHRVYRDDRSRLVFIVETAHKRYDVFEVPSNVTLTPEVL